MKIAVLGGNGLIGTKLVRNLRVREHEVVAASPATGVDILTGKGLAEAFTGAQVVVDVTNSPSFEDQAVLDFFETAAHHILPAEANAGVGHHVALSIVGTDRLPASGYLRAKLAQENLIKASKVPYTIVRSTQFFEFVGRIVESFAEGKIVRAPSAFVQPILSDDVANALTDVAIAKPLNGTMELGGPEQIQFDEISRRFLSANHDERKVITDVHAQYFGTELNDHSLTTGPDARIAPTHFAKWLNSSVSQV